MFVLTQSLAWSTSSCLTWSQEKSTLVTKIGMFSMRSTHSESVTANYVNMLRVYLPKRNGVLST